jgi:hypothetical protein
MEAFNQNYEKYGLISKNSEILICILVIKRVDLN